MRKAEEVSLDGYAMRLYENVATAIENFLGDPSAPVSEALRTKLGFVDTDLMRLAHVNLRYLEWLLYLRWPEERRRSTYIGVLAMNFAIRGWLRQAHIHNGFYKYFLEMQHSAAASSRGDGERELAAAMAAAPVLPPTARLEGIDRLHVVVVQKCKGG